MKGIGFAVKILITIVAALIMTITLIFFLLSNKMPTSYSSLEVGCLELLKDCTRPTTQINIELGGKSYTLYNLCQELGMDEYACKNHCGCS
jgi:hypothetical protein